MDLERIYESVKLEIKEKVQEVINKNSFVQSPYVTSFENNFSREHKISNVVGCSSGSTALITALKCLDIGPGDVVLTTPHTFMATAGAIAFVGGIPRFVDINPKTYNIDTDKIIDSIRTSQVEIKAIIIVHLCGNPFSVETLKEKLSSYGIDIKIIEDCAHAHFAEVKGEYVGTHSDISAFSFNPGKNLGAYGDAGAVATNNDDLAKKARRIIDHGRVDKFIHGSVGSNFRMDGIHGAVLDVKLKYIKEWTELRREHAKEYNTLLDGVVGTPCVIDDGKHSYHLYTVLAKSAEERDNLVAHLKESDIDARVHYPIPLHKQPVFSYLKEEDFPVTENIVSRWMTIPVFPELTNKEIKTVADSILEVVS